MISRIKTKLPTILKSEQADRLARNILSEIELAGMMPPTIKLSHIDANDNSWEPEYKVDPDLKDRQPY